MAIIHFSKFSPGGNETVFLHCSAHSPEMGANALKMLGGEQAGFVDLDNYTLTMAGGEFCVNASRAFGALIDYDQNTYSIIAPPLPPLRKYQIKVSGWATEIALEVSGKMPNWQVNAKLQLPPCQIEILDSKHTLVRLPGISHLLCFDYKDSYSFDEQRPFIFNAERKRRLFGLEYEPALGIIGCYEYSDSYFIIKPYVTVPAVGTAMVESCCGSATLALALFLNKVGNERKLRVEQPASSLNVLISENGLEAQISGPVTFMLKGILNTAFLF